MRKLFSNYVWFYLKYFFFLGSLISSAHTSFHMENGCKNDEVSIKLANNLSEIANLELSLKMNTNAKNKKTIKIKKQIAPGGMHTLCIPHSTKFTEIKPCLSSLHDENTKVYYTFDNLHFPKEPLAQIVISSKKNKPPIL